MDLGTANSTCYFFPPLGYIAWETERICLRPEGKVGGGREWGLRAGLVRGGGFSAGGPRRKGDAERNFLPLQSWRAILAG